MKGVVKNSSGMLWKEDLDLFKENIGTFVHRHKHLEVRILLSSVWTHTHCLHAAPCTLICTIAYVSELERKEPSWLQSIHIGQPLSNP